MKKPNQTKKTGMVMLTICLLCLVACKRDQFQPSTPNVLNSYRGTDKIVLQVVEELKKPDNKALLAEIEKQGSINWEYKVLITSRFMDGATLRFTTGSNGDYLDAELNAQTMAIKLYSKQQQEQRDAMTQQAFRKRLGGNSTQAGVCTFKVSFEVYVLRLTIFEMAIYLQFRSLLRDILSSQGFTVTSIMGAVGTAPKYEVSFESKNNETEADIRSFLVNSIEAYCKPLEKERDEKYCSWIIDKIKITSNCDAEDNNNPGPTVWGVNRDQALSSLKVAFWNHRACNAAQDAAERQFEALYQSYIDNATSASADIFRTRLSLLLADVPHIVTSYCRNVPPGPGTPVNPGGGGGGGSFNPEDPEELYELTVTADPIDLAKRFECFNGVPNNSSTIYSIRICADIPVNGNPKALLDANRSPGHTFIELTKANGANSVTQTIGFYPKSATKASFQVSVNSMVIDNKFHTYDASLFTTIGANQFENALNTAKTKSFNNYNMTGYNCTTFALDVFNAARASNNQLIIPNTVPQNTVFWTYGQTPNGLYQVIKDMQTNGISGASVAISSGKQSTNCN